MKNLRNATLIATCEDQLLLNECRATLAAAGFRGHVAVETNGDLLTTGGAVQAYGSHVGGKVVRRSAIGGLLGVLFTVAVASVFLESSQAGPVIITGLIAGVVMGAMTAICCGPRGSASEDRFVIRCRGTDEQIEIARHILADSPCRNLQVFVDSLTSPAPNSKAIAVASVAGE